MTETDAEFIAEIKALRTRFRDGSYANSVSRTAIPRLIGMVEERERERDEMRKKYDEHFIKRIMEIPDADLLALIPKDERDAAVVQGKQALKIGILTVERDAAIARAEAAESAQREAVAEVARLREALRTIRDTRVLTRAEQAVFHRALRRSAKIIHKAKRRHRY